MRSVLRWESLGTDLDLYSIQYEKTTKAVCLCYYGGTCNYTKQMVINNNVSKLIKFIAEVPFGSVYFSSGF